MIEHQACGGVSTVAVSANGQAIAAGDGAGYIYWLAQPGSLLWEERLADKVWVTILSTDGMRLLVGAGEKEAHLRTYDQAGRLLWRRYVGDRVSNLALSADGRRVAAGTREGGIYIFGEEGAILRQGLEDLYNPTLYRRVAAKRFTLFDQRPQTGECPAIQ